MLYMGKVDLLVTPKTFKFGPELANVCVSSRLLDQSRHNHYYVLDLVDESAGLIRGLSVKGA